MIEEIKKDEEQEIADKTLADEIADIDFTGEKESLDTSTEEDPKTVEEEKDETVEENEKSVDESKEVSDNEKKKEEDTKTSEEKKDEEVLAKVKGEKTEESEEKKETKGEVSQVDKLMTEIERLSGLVPTKPVEELPKKEEEGEKTLIEETVHDFIKDIDMDDVSSDPKVFNKILHKVIARVQQQTTEQVLRSIPQVVMSQVNQQSYFKRIADKFYEDNSDLVNVRQVVRACAQQVQKENPEWEIEKVFTETAKKTRETLGMSAHVVSEKKDETVPSIEDAAFAKSKGGSKSNTKRQKSSLQSEIDEL